MKYAPEPVEASSVERVCLAYYSVTRPCPTLFPLSFKRSLNRWIPTVEGERRAAALGTRAAGDISVTKSATRFPA